MAGELDGVEVAVLATDGVEQVDLDRPWQALEEAGAEPVLVSTSRNPATSTPSAPLRRAVHPGAAEVAAD